VPDAGSQVDYSTALAVLGRFNTYRVQASVPPVELDSTLCQGCQFHANDLVLNGISLQVVGLGAHVEDPALQGYTQAGAEAGTHSIIYQGVTPLEAVDNWMRTLYHRLGLLDPNLKRIGFGSAGGYQVMDVSHGRVTGVEAAAGTALFPSPGMVDAPLSFKNEIPYPIPGDTSLGVPITVEFFGQIGGRIAGVAVQVTDLTAQGDVECYIQWPGQPFLPEWDVPRLIAVIPRDPLVGGHAYRVRVDAWVDDMPWSASWEFSSR
jgi:hypothetical protein